MKIVKNIIKYIAFMNAKVYMEFSNTGNVSRK